MRVFSDQTMRIRDLRCLFTQQTRERKSECRIYVCAGGWEGLMHMCSEDCDPRSPSGVFLLHTLCMICLLIQRLVHTSPAQGSKARFYVGAGCRSWVHRLARQLLHHLNFTSGFDNFFVLFSLLINRYKSFRRNSQVSVFNKNKKTKQVKILVTLKMPMFGLCTCYVYIAYAFQNFVQVDKLCLYKLTLQHGVFVCEI